jgi:MOSC domain-containing protein YiiM
MSDHHCEPAARLFMGGIRPLPPENRPTGIFKQELDRPAWLGREGLAGDAQADRRVHGGPEKALHQYAVSNYARLAGLFPDARETLVPGSIGENLAVPGWDEGNVCIGDVFRLGDAAIQVSQPRSPCWKIDSRFASAGMARAIEDGGWTGWYFRVLEGGEVAPGCRFDLLERGKGALSIQALLALWREHRPSPDALLAMATTPGLSANWADKLWMRASKLGEMSGG